MQTGPSQWPQIHVLTSNCKRPADLGSNRSRWPLHTEGSITEACNICHSPRHAARVPLTLSKGHTDRTEALLDSSFAGSPISVGASRLLGSPRLNSPHSSRAWCRLDCSLGWRNLKSAPYVPSLKSPDNAVPIVVQDTSFRMKMSTVLSRITKKWPHKWDYQNCTAQGKQADCLDKSTCFSFYPTLHANGARGLRCTLVESYRQILNSWGSLKALQCKSSFARGSKIYHRRHM